MLFMSRTVLAPVSVIGLILFSPSSASITSAAAQEESKSAAVAKDLTQALDATKMDAIAAPDPSDPATFVAALYFQGSQLLVVSAKYAAPVLLVTKIGAKDYRDVYIDLQSASIQGSKVFVQDQLANGLAAKPADDAAADVWEEASRTISFDGDWKKAKLSEADYAKAFADADQKYARMLSLLLKSAKRVGS